MAKITETYLELEGDEKFEDFGWDKVPVTSLAPRVDGIDGLAMLFPNMSRGEIKRKIVQGALVINGDKAPNMEFSFAYDAEYKIRFGKGFRRVIYAR